MPHSKESAIDGLSAWPYPVDYGKENEVSTDVLILGGGVAGCHAAIMAARKGAKVAIVDKGAVIYSGSGGAGVDHWHGAIGNPCCKLTLDDMIQFFNDHLQNFLAPGGIIQRIVDRLIELFAAGNQLSDLVQLVTVGFRLVVLFADE